MTPEDLEFQKSERNRSRVTAIALAGFFAVPFAVMKLVYVPADDVWVMPGLFIFGGLWLWAWYHIAVFLGLWKDRP